MFPNRDTAHPLPRKTAFSGVFIASARRPDGAEMRAWPAATKTPSRVAGDGAAQGTGIGAL